MHHLLDIAIVLTALLGLISQMPTQEYCETDSESGATDGELLAIEIAQRVWGEK